MATIRLMSAPNPNIPTASQMFLSFLPRIFDYNNPSSNPMPARRLRRRIRPGDPFRNAEDNGLTYER